MTSADRFGFRPDIEKAIGATHLVYARVVTVDVGIGETPNESADEIGLSPESLPILS